MGIWIKTENIWKFACLYNTCIWMEKKGGFITFISFSSGLRPQKDDKHYKMKKQQQQKKPHHPNVFLIKFWNKTRMIIIIIA